MVYRGLASVAVDEAWNTSPGYHVELIGLMRSATDIIALGRCAYHQCHGFSWIRYLYPIVFGVVPFSPTEMRHRESTSRDSMARMPLKRGGRA